MSAILVGAFSVRQIINILIVQEPLNDWRRMPRHLTLHLHRLSRLHEHRLRVRVDVRRLDLTRRTLDTNTSVGHGGSYWVGCDTHVLVLVHRIGVMDDKITSVAVIGFMIGYSGALEDNLSVLVPFDVGVRHAAYLTLQHHVPSGWNL
jgi:hypothetical protein